MQMHLDSGSQGGVSPIDAVIRSRRTSQLELAGNTAPSNDWLSDQRSFAYGKDGTATPTASAGTPDRSLNLTNLTLIEQPPLYQPEKKGSLVGSSTPPLSRLDSLPAAGAEPATLAAALGTAGSAELPTPGDTPPTRPVQSATLSFNDFAPSADQAKFQSPNCKFDQSFGPDGTKVITYTAGDFTSCKLHSSPDGSAGLTIADTNGRPTYAETVSATGQRTVSTMTYHDEGGRPSPWLKSKQTTLPGGSVQTVNYDKFGKVVTV